MNKNGRNINHLFFLCAPEVGAPWIKGVKAARPSDKEQLSIRAWKSIFRMDTFQSHLMLFYLKSTVGAYNGEKNPCPCPCNLLFRKYRYVSI